MLTLGSQTGSTNVKASTAAVMSMPRSFQQECQPGVPRVGIVDVPPSGFFRPAWRQVQTGADFVKRLLHFVDHPWCTVGAWIHPAGFSYQFMAIDARAEELSGPDFALDRLIRDDPDSQSGLHHRLDDLDVLGVHHDRRLNVLGGEEMIDDASGRRSRFEQNEG